MTAPGLIFCMQYLLAATFELLLLHVGSSSLTRGWTHIVHCIGRWSVSHWTTRSSGWPPVLTWHSRAEHLDTLKPCSPSPPPPPPPPWECMPNSNLHEWPPSVMQRNNGGSAFSKANTGNYPCSTIVEQPWQNGSCVGIGGGEGQEVIFFSGCSLCSLCWLWGWFLRCVHISTLIKLYT